MARVEFPSVPSLRYFDLVRLARRRRDLAHYIEAIAEQQLRFRGQHAIAHSAHNHQHLWMIEWSADKDRAIDAAFRVAATSFILNRWRDRLAGYSPDKGFRLYVYEDMAPTVSVVAETGEGCPYGGDLTFVPRIEDVLALYSKRSWMAKFHDGGPEPNAILTALARHAGSLRRSAQRLGLGVAELRSIVERYGLAQDVNAIRKHHKRRPAQFADTDRRLPRVKIWEWKVGAGGDGVTRS